MLRSALDTTVASSIEFAEARGYFLPGFAHWDRARWLAGPPGARVAMERGLGWDVTDFGRGDFARVGLCLCTLRNGSLEERDTGRGQTYAEKLLFVGVGQETPFHLHREKTEDIINRAGGRLVVEVHPGGRGADGALILGDGDTNTLVDGLETTLPAGSRVVLEPGQSIQVPRGTVHRFWAEGAPVLGGEVSGVNDDLADNRFVEATARYPEVEEDCAARFLLVSEYRHVLEDDMRPGRKTR